MKVFIIGLVVSLGIPIAMRAQAPASADAIVKEATAIAAREHKNVFILFHASWCGWCHKMDTAMNDKAVRKYFTDNYIVRHLTVYESEGNKKLENPGALELLTRYKGNDTGIPYWLIFDKDGKLLADSKIRPEGGGLETGDNTGCPASENEVAHFIKVLKQTSSLQDAELSVIQKRFRRNESQ